MTDAQGTRLDQTTDERSRADHERQTVVDAALVLFVERGYRATYFADVAERAEVTIESITRSFGSKAGLAKAAFDVALAGDHDEISLADRDEDVAVRDEPDAERKLRLYALNAAQRHHRSAGIQLVIRDARLADPDAELVWETISEERLRAMEKFAYQLIPTGGLRSGLEPDEVRDVLWWVFAIEHYDLLVRERRWSLERYGAWLGQMLVAALVTPSRAP